MHLAGDFKRKGWSPAKVGCVSIYKNRSQIIEWWKKWGIMKRVIRMHKVSMSCVCQTPLPEPSALHLELATMRRNVQRWRSIIGRNIRQSGTSSNIHPPFKAMMPRHWRSWLHRCDKQHQGASSKNLPLVLVHEHYPKVPRSCAQHQNPPTWPSNKVSSWPSYYPRFPPPPTLLPCPQFPEMEAESSIGQGWGPEEPKTIWPHWRWDEVDPLMEEGGGSTHCYQPDCQSGMVPTCGE